MWDFDPTNEGLNNAKIFFATHFVYNNHIISYYENRGINRN